METPQFKLKKSTFENFSQVDESIEEEVKIEPRDKILESNHSNKSSDASKSGGVSNQSSILGIKAFSKSKD